MLKKMLSVSVYSADSLKEYGSEVIDMPLSKKEMSLLQDLKAEEQLCVQKYDKYASQACDKKLKGLFQKIGQMEQQHLDTVNQMMQGQVPASNASSSKPGRKPAKPDYKSTASKADKEKDAYLCSDVLATEKHVSSLYDTCIFEFKEPQMRTALNQIQGAEQHHGYELYEYMAQNKMY